MFHDKVPDIISSGNTHIMLLMLCVIVILPLAVRLLTFGKKNKVVMAYMSGGNTGNDRSFVDSYGDKKQMYLANWYMEDYFGEHKLLKPSLIISAAAIVIIMVIAIGGAI